MVETAFYFDILNVLSPVLSLAVNVFLQVLGFRCFASLSLLGSIIMGFLLGFAALLVIQAKLYHFVPGVFQVEELLAMIVTNALIYLLLGYCYFHFLNLGETARRIRILRELYDAKDGLTMEEILSRYNSKNMVAMRLERLLNTGQVSFVRNRYFIKNSFLLLTAKAIALLKLMIIGKKLGEGQG